MEREPQPQPRLQPQQPQQQQQQQQQRQQRQQQQRQQQQRQQQQQGRPEDGLNDFGGSRRINSNNHGNDLHDGFSSNANANGEREGSSSSPSSPSGVQLSESARSSDQGNSEENTISNTTDKNMDDEDEDVGSLREYDVLMGRGSGPNRHVGNIHFRAIVREVFDDFLDNHDGDGNNINNRRNSRSEMLRIDPSTKNRLAQAVLDKITLEKKGRFLQKLTKKEMLEASKKGTVSQLIRARANSMDAAAMAAEAVAATVPAAVDSDKDEDASTHDTSVNTVLYYNIIPEKQILAKIKQTFRFLRGQNEASYAAEKHRQRSKRMACRGSTREPSLQTSASTVLNNLNANVLSGNTSLAAYALLSQNPGLGAVLNPTPLAQQLNFGSNVGSGANTLNNSLSALPNGSRLWTGRNISNSMGAIPLATNSSLSSLNSLKNCTLNAGAITCASGNMDLASRILCDLPQSNRIISGSTSVGGSTSIFNGTPSPPFSATMGSSAQGLSNSTSGLLNKANPEHISTKRVLEELTLSRLVHLQKQREETINAYLSLERDTAAPSSAGIGGINASLCNRISPFDRLLDNMNGVNSSKSATANVNVPQNVNGLNMGALGGMNANGNNLGNNVESISLLLQLQNNGFPTNFNVHSGKNSLRAFGSL